MFGKSTLGRGRASAEAWDRSAPACVKTGKCSWKKTGGGCEDENSEGGTRGNKADRAGLDRPSWCLMGHQEVCPYLASSLRMKPTWGMPEPREGRTLHSWWHCWSWSSFLKCLKFLFLAVRGSLTDNYSPRSQSSSSQRLPENLSPFGFINVKFFLFYFSALPPVSIRLILGSSNSKTDKHCGVVWSGRLRDGLETRWILEGVRLFLSFSTAILSWLYFCLQTCSFLIIE